MKLNEAKKKPLEGKVAIVSGATRGAGRGIACMLGEAGAIVYCTGRSVSGEPPAQGVHAGRTETIEETAEMVTNHGGTGIYARVDHTDEAQVVALIERVRVEQRGRLDILVNVLGGDTQAEWKPFWKQSLDKGLRWLSTETFSHIITSRHAAALMVERKQKGALVVGITDGDGVGYRGSFFFDLVKVNTIRLAYAMAEELASKGIASVAISPGFMRTEWMLDHFGATEENWREVALTNPEAKSYGFIASETPCFVGRAVAALAADPRVLEKSGGVYGSWTLSEEYGFTDVDGNRPHMGRYFEEHFKEMFNAPTKTGFRWKLERDTPPAQANRRARAK
ncbi:MAG TPA: SDR family oxidoreductase [Pyrinomonadaceae bacterium]|jgi:NAD(P)-dependent dehydrogenase (short-subunit alcohol dehydrogenase family)|nr:SDR family oxidoreductase [Pyrinomonadaceae bacterium]